MLAAAVATGAAAVGVAPLGASAGAGFVDGKANGNANVRGRACATSALAVTGRTSGGRSAVAVVCGKTSVIRITVTTGSPAGRCSPAYRAHRAAACNSATQAVIAKRGRSAGKDVGRTLRAAQFTCASGGHFSQLRLQVIGQPHLVNQIQLSFQKGDVALGVLQEVEHQLA